MNMIVRVVEKNKGGKVLLEFSFVIATATEGREWLVTNGFQHISMDYPHKDYWIREGKCRVTFKGGIMKDKGCTRLCTKDVKYELRADFVEPVELKNVVCETTE
jgi:hypothetical protein